MRLTLERAWNAYVRGNLRISVRFFARLHGLAETTWRREPGRGAAGVRLVREGGRRERQPQHQAVAPEGHGLLQGPAGGHPRRGGHRQLDAQTLAERRDRK